MSVCDLQFTHSCEPSRYVNKPDTSNWLLFAGPN